MSSGRVHCHDQEDLTCSKGSLVVYGRVGDVHGSIELRPIVIMIYVKLPGGASLVVTLLNTVCGGNVSGKHFLALILVRTSPDNKLIDNA